MATIQRTVIVGRPPLSPIVFVLDGDFSVPEGVTLGGINIPQRTVEVTDMGDAWMIATIIRASDHRLIVAPPANANAIGRVRVTVRGDSQTAEKRLPGYDPTTANSTPQPLITAVIPDHAAHGDAVKIHGEDLGDPSDAVEVVIGTVNATVVPANRATTEITATVPTVATLGPSVVRVTVNSVVSNDCAFTVDTPAQQQTGGGAGATDDGGQTTIALPTHWWARPRNLAAIAALAVIVIFGGGWFVYTSAKFLTRSWKSRPTIAAMNDAGRMAATTPAADAAATQPADATRVAIPPTLPPATAPVVDAGIQDACVTATQYLAVMQDGGVLLDASVASRLQHVTPTCFPPNFGRVVSYDASHVSSGEFYLDCSMANRPYWRFDGDSGQICWDLSECHICRQP